MVTSGGAARRPFSLFSITGPGVRIFLGYRGVLWRYPFYTVLRRLELQFSKFYFLALVLPCICFYPVIAYLMSIAHLGTHVAPGNVVAPKPVAPGFARPFYP